MKTSGYQDALQRHFGFSTFREGQEAVIDAVMAGRDCLAVMPTGGGKSLCFQLPAVMRPGLTLVISPLIALMKDQVDGLANSGIAATFVNSSLSASERNQRLRDLANRRYDLVYVAPERFRSPRFVEAMTAAGVDLFAVDEAHCVSMWGHDFRPDYLQLADVLPRLGQPQVLCLTATATPEVRDDIIGQLHLGVEPRGAPEVVVRGFARPSLTLAVSKVRGQDDKYRRTQALAFEHRTGIVYCATRKSVEKVSARLRDDGVRCVGYHAGMGDEVRSDTQERFVSGEVDVVVATNAFGMGIDRADLRFIVHWEVPGSLEAYYQEAGRAGRDGDPAHCELLYNYADVRTQEFFNEGSNPPAELVRGLGREVARSAGVGPRGEPVSAAAVFAELTTGGRANQMALETALGVLSRLDVVRRIPDSDGGPALLVSGPAAADIDDLDLDFLREKADRDQSRLRRLLRFVNTKECRHATVLRYFGDPTATGVCGNRCDNCLRRSGVARVAGAEPSRDEWLRIQKALSAVARLQGRFGQTRVAQVLAGSKDQAVLRAGLDQTSTYGLLADVPLKAIRGLLDALEDAECIECVGDEYPTIRLTEYGSQVMRRETTVSLVLPESMVPKIASPKTRSRGKGSVTLAESVADEAVSPEDARQMARLAETLQTWRRGQAAARGKPAYTVFSNATLAEIARLRPTTDPALLAVKGIGPAKLTQYGDDILALVQQHLDDA